jgi:hypothetical protein
MEIRQSLLDLLQRVSAACDFCDPLTYAPARMTLRPYILQGGVGCPALPFGFCPRLWDERHIPGMEEDDAAIYSEALARRRHWPLWLIIVRLASLFLQRSPCVAP